MTGTVSTAAPVLPHRIGVWSAVALVVSNMIGTGIFTTTGFLAGDLGEPSLVIGIWVVGALFALAGALCYSELGINFHISGVELRLYPDLIKAFAMVKMAAARANADCGALDRKGGRRGHRRHRHSVAVPPVT